MLREGEREDWEGILKASRKDKGEGRYGRVQSVKVVSRGAESGPGPGGACATVSFMDIKSASKAHSVDQKLEECALTTEYHEPAAIPREPPPTPSPAPATTPLPLYSSPRFNHGSRSTLQSAVSTNSPGLHSEDRRALAICVRNLPARSSDNVSDKYLSVQFSQFGPVSHVEIDRSRGQALVFYQQVLFAQLAVNGMRGVVMRSRKLQVDFASRECQDAFYESQKSSNMFDNRSFEDAVIEEKMVVVIQQAPSEMRHQKERMSLDEEDTSEHRRKCKHRRSHSGENSRPGTPLCDEKPEYTSSKHHDTTSAFPLFSNSLSLSKPPPSPPPSPPLRPPSSSSEDSEPSTSQLSDWELRLKSLDERYEKWSGNRTVTATTKTDSSSTGQKVRHKLLDLNVHELQPSDIVKSVLAKRSIFDEDSKRLENMNDKYEPKEYIPSRIGLQNFRSYLPPTPTPPVPINKGLQYPFPSHPHVVNNCHPPPPSRTVSLETSKPVVPMPNNIRRNSTNSNSTTLGDTARRRSREEPQQPIETKNVNETRIKLETKPSTETSTNMTSDNKDVKAIPSPSEDIKPAIEEGPHLVENNCTVDVKPSPESLPKSEPVLVIKHELPSAPEVKTSAPTIIERRKSTSIEEVKPSNRETIEEKAECNTKTLNHANSVLTPCVTSKPKDCDLTDVDNNKCKQERDIERDRRKSKDIVVENSSSSSSIDTTSKTKPNETSTDKVDSKEKKDVKHNCVDVHSKHKDRRDSEKRKEKENVEVKSNNQRKDHDNHKSQVNDRRSSKEEHEDREKKRNNEHSSSKQHKSRESESEHSTSRHHNNVARKDKHKSSSRHKESDKKSHDHEETKRKDSHDESKRKETHQDEHRKRENHEDKKKDNAEDSKKKDHEESKKKDKDHDEKRKESCEEKRKDVSEDKRRETVDDHKRKDSGEERRKDTDDHKRKEVDDHKRKEIVDDHKRKDIVDDHRRKESCEEKRKEILDDHKRKESTDDHKRKENTDDHKRKENTDDHKRKETVDDHKRKESVDDHKRKESVDDHKRKESVDDHKRKESTDDHKRKENTDDHKRKEPVEDKRKESTEEKRKEVEDKRKENCDERRKDSFEEKRREIVDDHRKKDTVDEAKRKDVAEDHKRKESVEEHKRKDHDDRHSRDEKESHSHTPRHNSHNKDKEHRDSCDTKHEHSGHKKKDSEDSNRVKRKDSDHHHHDSSKRKEEERNKERRKERYSLDSTETVVKKENEAGEKKKEFDMFKVERKRSYDNSDKTRKEETVTTDKKETSSLMENISDAEESADKRNHIRKEQRKDRTSNNSWHATVGCKRRLSSQDSQDSTLEDIKRMKPERRDSKDSKDSNKSSTSTSSSSSSSSQKKHSDKDKHQKIAKMLEEKIKEDKEKESHVKPKKENKESDDNDSPKARKEKKNSETKLSENESGEKKKRTRSIRENGLTTCSESETGSCDDEGRNKKHSIFDIVDDTPAYISMYDKVKARSCKNMQKHEEEQKKKEKFTQLKQSRAKREEKKRSTSYDEDTDSERGIGRRNSKHMITSSEDDFTSECETNKTKSKKTIMSDTSDDDVVKSAVKSKLKAKSRLLRSEESELDSTQDSMQSFIKSEPKVKIEREENTNTTASIKEEHGAEEKDISVNNKTSVDTDSETHGKKKSHRKKEKRQKSMDSSLSCSDINLSSKKEKHKKERRKSHNHDSDASGKHVKSRKKKTSSSKKDIKLETSLFEPLSDDSSTPMMKDQSMSNNTSKWQVGQVFSDSDSDEITRIQDKKRRERKSRELDEAGKALEAKLLDETDHFDATSVLVEKVKKKKKKKKKHHNHHKQRNIEHEEGDGDDEDEEARSAENEPTPPITAQCLSSLLESPPLSVAANKKPDIPGFGLPMDAHVHDSAVKSISECENLPAMKKIPDPEPAPVEEKPTVVISQEETEDAVAALLGDAFGGHFEEDYNMEDNKPGSPENLSEPDLQIDTDTEDTFDTLDFSKPPRTPDYPSHFENFTGKDKIKPGFVPPKTPDTKSVELAKKPNHEMKTETQGSPQQANVTKGMKQDKTPEPSPVKLPELRPFDTFKPEDKPAESRGYASLEVVNKTSKATNVPSSSVLFTEQSLLKHNKTTELLSHGAWTDKPLANLHNKPITSLEQSIHKTVNLMDQYINKSPKPALDQIIKSKNQENVVYKPNNTTSNMLHPYDRVTSSEQVFTNKPVVLSEQYKNIQNPDLVKNCIVSSELMHQKSILSVCKPPMSDVKSVITINKCIVTPSSLHDPHKTMNKSVVVPTSLQDATKTNKSIGVPTSLQDKTINKTVVVSTSVHDAQRIINKPITPTSLSDASKLINKTVVVSTSLLESSKTMNKFVTTSTPLHDDNRSLVIPSSLQETAQNMNRTVVTTSLADASKFINKSIGVPTSLHDKIVTTSVVVSTSQQDLSKSINKSIGVTSLQDKPTIKPIVASPFLQDAAKNKPLVSPTSLPDAHKVMNKPVVTPTTLQDPSKTINKFVTVPTSLQDKPMNRSILVPTSLHETSKINKPVPTTVHSVQDVSTNKFVGVPTALPDKSVNPCTVATALPDFKGTVKSPAETNVQTHSAATTPEPPKQTSPSPKDSAFSHLIQAIDQTMANEKADKSVNAFSKPDEDKPNHVSPVTIKEEDLIAKQKLEKLYSNIQPDKYQFGNKTLTITDHTYVVNSCDTPSKSAVPEHNEAKPECKPEPNIVKFVEELEQQLNEEKSQNLRKQNLALEEKTQQNQHRNVLPEDKSQQNQHRNVPLPEDKSQQNQQHRNVPLPEEKSQQTQHQNLPLAEEKSQQPQHRNLLVEESRKQHLDLLEKKEDHVGPIVAPLTPKMEEKPAIFVSPGESSCEPKDVESAQTRKEITEDIKDKSDEDSSGRRGRRRKNNASTPATSRMGGVVTRRTRFSNPVTSPAPATSETKPSPPAEEVKPAPAPERKCLSGDEVKSSDVYEFKDDSDEDEAATRPLLSIKSPHDAKSPHDTKVHDVKSPRDMRSPHESKSPRPHDTKHDAKSPAEHKPDTKSPETKGTPKPASEKTSHETKASQDAKPHELKSPDKSSPDVKSEKSDAVAMGPTSLEAPVSLKPGGSSSPGVHAVPRPIPMDIDAPRPVPYEASSMTDGEHCMLLALPCGRTEVDVVQQSAYLQSGFITYLQQKQAAGIVNIAAPGTQQAAYIVHVFPSCEFANNSLAQIDAQLLKKVSELTYLVIIIATTANSATV
ncbi:hypothetical protein M8J76_002121 [Diaphorina citri]|nr:hypothetical protein M8J76_002121 [Diaphorina citri]